MNEWITDHRQTEDDADYGILGYDNLVFATDLTGQVTKKNLVFATDLTGQVIICSYFFAAQHGFPWQPIMIPEPYVKPKRYKIVRFDNAEWGVLRIADYEYVAHSIAWNAREAAEEIEAIFERLMP